MNKYKTVQHTMPDGTKVDIPTEAAPFPTEDLVMIEYKGKLYTIAEAQVVINSEDSASPALEAIIIWAGGIVIVGLIILILAHIL